jgi:hypothetical protein
VACAFGILGYGSPNGSFGGPTNPIYVDASGAQDPAAIEASVHRAMSKYAPGLVGGSVSAMLEYQKRQPLSKRN